MNTGEQRLQELSKCVPYFIFYFITGNGLRYHSLKLEYVPTQEQSNVHTQQFEWKNVITQNSVLDVALVWHPCYNCH